MKKIIIFVLCILTMVSCVACATSKSPDDEPSLNTPETRREPSHVATFIIQESAIWFAPNETVFTLFGLTQEDIDAEKAYCAENNITFSMSLDARVFNGTDSALRYTPLSQLNIRPEAIVWKYVPADEITLEVTQMKNRQAVYTYTATLKFGTQERDFIETYEYEETTHCRYSGDYKFQDARPQRA